jgi:hypothetical protein
MDRISVLGLTLLLLGVWWGQAALFHTDCCNDLAVVASGVGNDG